MSSRIIVLGSSGFIGKALCNELKNKGKSFLGLSSNELNLLNELNIREYFDAFNSIDSLVFISALAPCKNKEMYDKNILMINNFVRAVFKCKIKHFIYISSDAVYKDSPVKITENDLMCDSNMHAKMHKDREEIIKKFCTTNQIDLSILRPTLVYGPGDTHNGYGPNKFIREINAGKNILLFGRGEEKRDHIFIYDLVKIISEVVNNKILGEITLATGEVSSFYDIAKLICDIKKISYKKIQFVKRNGPMPHNGYRAFDISNLKKSIKKLKITSFEEGLKNSINNLY